MKKLILGVMAACAFLVTQPAMSLEPWHDYYRQKAHQDKKAKKARQAQEAAKTGEKPGERPATKEERKQ